MAQGEESPHDATSENAVIDWDTDNIVLRGDRLPLRYICR